MRRDKWHFDVNTVWRILLCVAVVSVSGCGRSELDTTVKGVPVHGLPMEANRVIQERELTPDDVTAALATFMPTGRFDEYVMFASGGHSGQVLVIGMPSMRLLKAIAVFTPEPWQGAGYGVKESALEPTGKPAIGRSEL